MSAPAEARPVLLVVDDEPRILSALQRCLRREGYEIAVSRPQVILKEIDGVMCEPYESLVADVEDKHQGGTITGLAERGGKMLDMVPDGRGRVRLSYMIPSRGLIGFQTEFMSMTSGTGSFDIRDRWMTSGGESAWSLKSGNFCLTARNKSSYHAIGKSGLCPPWSSNCTPPSSRVSSILRKISSKPRT